MEIVAVIPARFGSTRLPGKPLLSDTGKPLIQHVVEAARRARRLSRVSSRPTTTASPLPSAPSAVKPS